MTLSIAGLYAETRFQRFQASVASGQLQPRALVEQTRAASAEGDQSYATLLEGKRVQALAALERHTSLRPFDASLAAAAIANVEAWRAQNTTVWQRIEQKVIGTFDSVGANEVLAMPRDMAQAYLEALYQSASYGLSMYDRGLFASLVQVGELSMGHVQADAEARLSCFDTILTLEDLGVLSHLYEGYPMPGMDGYGGPEIPAAALIVLAVAVGIAVVVLSVNAFRQVTVNNELKEKKCEEYLRTKNPSLAGACDPTKNDLVVIAQYALLVGTAGALVYFLVPYIPKLVKELRT